MKTLADAIETAVVRKFNKVGCFSFPVDAATTAALDWMEEKIHELEDPDALNLYLRRDLLKAIKEEPR